MSSNHHIWRIWVDYLHRWGLNNLVASLLEAAGPLTILGAQAVYASQPLLRGLLPSDQLHALATMLEDSRETKSFAAYLREEFLS